MKKIHSLFALLLLTAVFGQTFKYGVTGNFHKGSIKGVHDASKGKFGGGLGVFGQIPLVENDVFDSAWLYLMPQLEYSMQGENADADKERYEMQRFNHDYIGMQLYLKYFFHNNGVKKDFFVFAGPRIEFLVRDKREVSALYDVDYFKYNKDDEVNDFGYGVSLGAGLQVSEQIEAFIRYDRGFSKVYPNNDLNNTYNQQLAVGINFYLNSNGW